jgi:acyl-CoA thioester hydrolase
MTDPHAIAPSGAATGVVVDGVHRLPLRVYYEDTDAGGIVYHANYLRFAERARTEMMRVLGAEHTLLKAESGAVWAVRAASADFFRPARLDDVVVVETRVQEVGGATVRLSQRIFLSGGPRFVSDLAAKPPELAHIQVRLACLDGDGRPVRLPPRARMALSGVAVLSTR